VLEDICHAFFASHETGARDFAGEAAIFSLPKFFGLRMMAGGVLTRDPSLARDLRARRDAAPEPPSVTARRQARTWLRQGKTGGLDLEALYLERLVNPRLAVSELAGAPVTLADIRAVGAARRVTVDRLLAATANLPAEWSAMLGATLPFVFPVFGEPGRLARLDADLAAMGVQAGVYQIDVARNCYAPAYRPAVLLPCHHQIGARLAKVISLLHGSS
jgi:dTDP-4-amino-4,6-dideoxygalactose transaminase